MLIIDERVLLSVKNDHRIVKSLVVSFDPIDGVEEGLCHFCRQKWDHESIFEDVVHVFVVLSQGRRVYHRVDYQVLQIIPQLLNDKQFGLWKMSISREAKEGTCEKASTDSKLRPL